MTEQGRNVRVVEVHCGANFSLKIWKLESKIGCIDDIEHCAGHEFFFYVIDE
jgi:hypothetical protein